MLGFKWGAVAVTVLVLGASVAAQDASKLAFEVVAIRPQSRAPGRLNECSLRESIS